ncbi:MAG: NAD-dependent epimerase/dehydratase family protein [Sinobacteraceae bacterium]|nr:NAD-dependent epimerase/dehydratase family protein [Nevskiaceae bacterium]
MILITGATGRTGSHVARELAARGLPVRALVRNPAKAAALAAAGVELVTGDAGDAESVRAAMRGVHKVAVIFPNGEQQLKLEKQVVDVAVAAGVAHVLKISSMEALPTAHNPTHRVHWDSEEHIRSSGAAWTMVRPSFYMQNFFANAASIKAEGKFYYPFGEKGAAALTDSRDAGYFAAHCLATNGHENKSYDITSPDKLSFHEVAAVFSRELGRRIDYVPQDPAAYKAYLGKFLASRWHLDAVCDIFAEIAAGYVVEPTSVFKQVTGRDPVTLAQFVRDFRAVFTP